MPLDKGRVDRRNSYKKLQRKTREKGKKGFKIHPKTLFYIDSIVAIIGLYDRQV